MRPINRILKASQDACWGEIEVRNNRVRHVCFKGANEPDRNGWSFYFQNVKVGDLITEMFVDSVLSYNDNDNIRCEFVRNDEFDKF